MSTAWYVAETHPCLEPHAVMHLTKQGFKPWLPTCLVRKAVRGKVVEVVLPLFPCYLLVQLDLGIDRWRTIRSTRGVKRLLGNNPERPVAVEKGVMAVLLERFGDGPVADPDMAVGSLVRVMEGPLAGCLGNMVSSAQDRVRILMRLLGRDTVCTVPYGWVEKG